MKNKKISLTENGMTLKLVGINNKSNELQPSNLFRRMVSFLLKLIQ